MRRQKTEREKAHYRKRRNTGQRRKRQCGGFINRYDFAYVGRDTVNQAAKVPHLVLLKLPQTILTILLNKGLIKSYLKVEQKWKECFPKY